MFEIKGKSNALNAMIQYCKYDWIAILDVDDIWLPTKLEKQVPFMDRFDIVGTKCVYFERLEGTVPKIPVGDISDFDFKTVNPMINSSALIKKTLTINYGWNSAYDGVEDYDLWLQLRKNGKRFYNVDEVLVKHRIHPSSAFNSQDQSAKLKEILSR
jgi:glycosyltransferase involved in cell wall biosynthesis